jgi:hypothetical protein
MLSRVKFWPCLDFSKDFVVPPSAALIGGHLKFEMSRLDAISSKDLVSVTPILVHPVQSGIAN